MGEMTIDTAARQVFDAWTAYLDDEGPVADDAAPVGEAIARLVGAAEGDRRRSEAEIAAAIQVTETALNSATTKYTMTTLYSRAAALKWAAGDSDDITGVDEWRD